MSELSCLLQEHGIDFDPQDSHIMCLPHVLNICSKHATDNFTSTDFTPVPETLFEFPGSSTNKHAYVEALRKDPAVCAHNMVRIVHSSSLHCESFKAILLDGNSREYWRDEEQNIIELPVLKLLCEVKTCWDSRYFMVKWLWLYCQVCCDNNPYINLIFQQDIRWFFALPGHQDIASWKLSEADWTILEDLEMVLEVRFTCPRGFLITNSVSGSSLRTAKYVWRAYPTTRKCSSYVRNVHRSMGGVG